MVSFDTVHAAENIIRHFDRHAAIVAADWADSHWSRGEIEEYRRLKLVIQTIVELENLQQLARRSADRRR